MSTADDDGQSRVIPEVIESSQEITSEAIQPIHHQKELFVDQDLSSSKEVNAGKSSTSSNKALTSVNFNHYNGGTINEVEKTNSQFLSKQTILKSSNELFNQCSVNERTRVILTSDELQTISKADLIKKWNEQELYIQFLQSNLLDVNNLKPQEYTRLRAQVTELQKKEHYHIMRLATKEHELQEFGAQVEELKGLSYGSNSLKNTHLDPAVNLLFERMKRELDSSRSKLEETQNELAAWKFTPDSNTGKQLMAKCRLLIKENEELGKMISSGRLAKLEGELALQKGFVEEMKKSQSELEEFLQEMDEDTEGMQGTILHLQSELRVAKEKISHHTSSTPNPETTQKLFEDFDSSTVTSDFPEVKHELSENNSNEKNPSPDICSNLPENSDDISHPKTDLLVNEESVSHRLSPNQPPVSNSPNGNLNVPVIATDSLAASALNNKCPTSNPSVDNKQTLSEQQIGVCSEEDFDEAEPASKRTKTDASPNSSPLVENGLSIF